MLAEAEHFVRGPDWTWYILFYFFLAGLSGGSYVIATLLRLSNRGDEPAARVGFYLSFVTLLGCPVLLTLDLGQPLRFWHMLVNTTPGSEGLNFKYWSPMSVGAWALVVFGVFGTVSFFEALVRDRVIRLRVADWLVRVLNGVRGKLWNVLGALVGLFVAGYTGVLLAVSNQPVWSDTWTLGALFLASGLSGSAALIGWFAHRRRDAQASVRGLVRGERYFQVLELVLIGLFVVTLIPAGALVRAFGFPWTLLWALALVGLLIGLRGPGAYRPVPAGGTPAAREGGATMTTATVTTATMARATATSAVAIVPVTLVLLGVLALRAAVIFSAQ
jgi:formate-dependent nitrite reductase membrane component NrfD